MTNPLRNPLVLSFLAVAGIGASAACAASPPRGEAPAPTGDAPRACTEMGCVDGLVIDFEPTSGWPAGAYKLDVTIDGRLTTCTGSLPLSSCDAPSFRCTSGAVQVGESGCAIGPATHGLSGLQFDRATQPQRVDIVVSRDGTQVKSASLSPSYQRVQPNGKDCPPVCEQSVQRVSVF